MGHDPAPPRSSAPTTRPPDPWRSPPAQPNSTEQVTDAAGPGGSRRTAPGNPALPKSTTPTHAPWAWPHDRPATAPRSHPHPPATTFDTHAHRNLLKSGSVALTH